MNLFERAKLLIALDNAIGNFQKVISNMQPLTVSQVLKSKIFWTNVVAFAIAGYGQISGQLPKQVTDVVSAAAPILTIFWKIFFNQQIPIQKQPNA
jgi:hypothetical protein